MKRVLFFLMCFFCFSLSFASAQGKNVKKERLSIAVSFNAMAELAKIVAGDIADISLIIPEGMEPHEAEPTPQNLAFLSAADVLIFNGLGMEFYLEKTLAAIENKSLTLVEASKGIKPISLEDDDDDEMDEHEEHEENEEGGTGHHHHHHHGAYDPHAWLSPASAKVMVRNIQKALSKIDKKHSKAYAKNANAYIQKLDALIKEYKGKFKQLENKRLVASHAAFAYLCRDFGLIQSSIQDVFAEGEPNAKDLVTLVEYCREHNIKTIFSEEVASTALAETLSREIGGKVVKIYTMEMSEDDMDYFSRMEENLKRIYENLK